MKSLPYAALLFTSLLLASFLSGCNSDSGPRVDNSSPAAFHESIRRVQAATDREDDQAIILRVYHDIFEPDEARNQRFRIDGMNSRELLEWSTTYWAEEQLHHAEQVRLSEQRLREADAEYERRMERVREYFGR